MHTGWAALGLAAAGPQPARRRAQRRDVATTSARTPARCAATSASARARSSRCAPPALARAGRRPRPARASSRARRSADGSFAGRVNTTAFALLALRAAGRPADSRAVRAGAGSSPARRTPTAASTSPARAGRRGADDTGAALQALGRGRARRVGRRAARAPTWLEPPQNADGGFALQGGPSNAQSTAWAVQGLIAAGRDPARVRRGGSRSPLAYLRSLIGSRAAPSATRARARQTPVWVTAQALTALARQGAPARARAARASRGGAPRRRGTGADGDAAAGRADAAPARDTPSRLPAEPSASRADLGVAADPRPLALGSPVVASRSAPAARRARSRPCSCGCGGRRPPALTFRRTVRRTDEPRSIRRTAAARSDSLPRSVRIGVPKETADGRAARRARARRRAQAHRPGPRGRASSPAPARRPASPTRRSRRRARRSATARGTPTSSPRSRRPQDGEIAALRPDSRARRLPRPADQRRRHQGARGDGRDGVRDGGDPAHLARPVDGRALQPGHRRRLPRRAHRRAGAWAASSRC